MSLSINGVSISDEAVEHETRFHEDAAAPREAARRALAVRELLLQRAAEIGLAAPDAAEHDESAEEALIDALLAREVVVPEPTDEECRRYYDANPARFRSGDLVEASHILFAVTPSAPVNEIRATAEATLKAIVAEPRRFAEFAGSHSNCPSGAHGGNLGQLKRGETVPEFESAVFAGTSTGVIPRLVNTRYGFHVVAIARRVAGRLVPFEAVREKVAARLAEQVGRKALEQYLSVLAGKADVQGVELNAAATPLVR